MRRKTMPLVPVLVLALLVMAIPTAAWAAHEVPDERPPTPLVDFREAVGSWLDPWSNETPSDIKDDHAPLLAFALYEELLGIKPMTCYYDTYAAYWAVAAGLRALGQAPNREQQEGEFERVFEDIARADALGELSALHCLTRETDMDDIVELETTPTPVQDPGEETGSSRVIEIEATGALQFTDGRGDLLHEIAVTPGETVVFRVHNSADFEHSFYIGSESELHVPAGTTDTGVGMWRSGVRELEWRVPDDVSNLMFGCTVPGHFTLMHGTFVVAPPEKDTPSE
jgi:uncharacterized cupredoxin-like copper-binding protein